MTVQIELLVVADCPNEATAAQLIKAALLGTGVEATIAHTIIASTDHAQQRRFIGSPTILLNGIDPFTQPEAPVALACRLYATPDGPRGVPGLEELRQAIKRTSAN
jgi:hypothetical protein